jgi:predicted NUDIX family phosphoesterase
MYKNEEHIRRFLEEIRVAKCELMNDVKAFNLNDRIVMRKLINAAIDENNNIGKVHIGQVVIKACMALNINANHKALLSYFTSESNNLNGVVV